MSFPSHSPAEDSSTPRTNKPSRAQPRDDRQDGEKEAAQSSAHVSPAMRLYRHALESILGSLNLHDLSQILAVSREWSAAVRSMKSIGATIECDEWQTKSKGKLFRPLPPISSLVTGPLLRHVAGIHIKDKDNPATPLTGEALALLSQYAPNLTSLWCSLTLTTGAPLVLPAKLASLELTLSDQCSDAEINRVLSALAALPSLSRLCVRMFPGAGVDLSLLAASRTLSDLSLGHFDLSDAQVDQIRSSLGHLEKIDVGMIQPADLARLLQPPVTARWQDIGHVPADAHTGDLLVTLPTLTRLDLDYRDDAPHADFLSKLPLLSSLKLDCVGLIPEAPLLSSLLPCIGLTELSLRCGFNSSQVGALLAALTNLLALRLTATLDSLRCFASGPATRTLQSLFLSQLFSPFPPSELVHLYALKALRSLELHAVFASLDLADMASLTPPTAHLPRLTRFVHARVSDWRMPVERTGPSFEWMQQRLIQ